MHTHAFNVDYQKYFWSASLVQKHSNDTPIWQMGKSLIKITFFTRFHVFVRVLCFFSLFVCRKFGGAFEDSLRENGVFNGHLIKKNSLI